MHMMFVHQNFPAQFRYIAPRLVRDFGWKCTFVTERAEGELPGVDKIVYQTTGGATRANHYLTRGFENANAQAFGVYQALRARPDVRPDLVVAHSGFGSSLYLPFLYDAPIINFFESFYSPSGSGIGYRPEMPVREMVLLRTRARNAMIMLDLENCDRGWTPTHYQRDYLPEAYRNKVEVIFDGIDTEVYHRKPNPQRSIGGGKCIPPGPRIVTYVARGFEMMRGFDIFMKAAKRIAELYPDVVFVVVGTDKVCYGGDLSYIQEKTFGQHVLGQDQYDMSRFHFTGYVPQETLADILSITDLHIYLTEPFIASWSMVDAMACGAVLLASDQICVREYVKHGENGLLCDFFDYEAMAQKAVEVLKDPGAYHHLGEAAVRTVAEKYSLDLALPRLNRFFESVATKPRSPSVRVELLARDGDPRYQNHGDDDEPLSGQTPSAPVVATAGAVPAIDGNAPGGQMAALLAQAAARAGDIMGLVQAVQAFRPDVDGMADLGPRQHPTDMSRLLTRVREWKVQLLLDIGADDPGRAFLWTRVAGPNARIVLAALPGRTWSPVHVELLRSMAGKDQKVICIQGMENADALAVAVEQACQHRKADFAFLHGMRPADEVHSDYKRYRRLLRNNALMAWNGIRPMAPRPAEDGGDRLWASLKPMYPQHAEYLSGCGDACGGIAMIKV